MRAPLVRKGTPAAHALSLALRTAAIRRSYNRARRRLEAEYGRNADPMLLLLLNRYEERLDALETTSEALMTHVLEGLPAPVAGEQGRVCLNPACRVPLYGMKSTAECCSNVCRSAVHRLRVSGDLPPREPVESPST
jgi:hypothetical protein